MIRVSAPGQGNTHFSEKKTTFFFCTGETVGRCLGYHTVPESIVQTLAVVFPTILTPGVRNNRGQGGNKDKCESNKSSARGRHCGLGIESNEQVVSPVSGFVMGHRHYHVRVRREMAHLFHAWAILVLGTESVDKASSRCRGSHSDLQGERLRKGANDPSSVAP